MHVRELVELATSIAEHADVLIGAVGGLSEEGVDAYWTASKKRLDHWNAVLSKSIQTKNATAEPPRDAIGPDDDSDIARYLNARMIALAEEVLASELLTRVWAAVLGAAPHLPSHHTTAAVGRSVYLGHQEVRLGVLNWMANGPLAGTPPGDRLNLLRRRCERWTDLLLGRIQLSADVAAFGFDSARVRDYRDDFQNEIGDGTFVKSWRQMRSALDSAMRAGLTTAPLCGRDNTVIGASVLASVRDELPIARGAMHGAWLYRVEQLADKTHAMVDRLLTSDRL